MRRMRRDIEPRYLGVSFAGAEHRAEDTETGCFAGSVGAEQAEDFARLDVESDVFQGVNPAQAKVVEVFGKVANVDHADGELGKRNEIPRLMVMHTA